MATITIEIPDEVLTGRKSVRRLVAVDPKEFEKELRRRWDLGDAKKASKTARREWEEKDTLEAVRIMERERKQGKLRVLTSMKALMKP